MNPILHSILKIISGRLIFQNFFFGIYRLGLFGMNYGMGGSIKDSGELNVFKIINRRFQNETKVSIFDVGGNVGKYSLALANFFGDKAHIHAFEPSSKTYEKFKTNTKKLTQLKVNNLGLSKEKGTLILYKDSDESALASMYNRNVVDMKLKEEVALSTLDAYCMENNIDRIHFLKLDVEGHELEVLQGAFDMLTKKQIDYIQFEFGGCNIDSRTFFMDFYNLLSQNYKIYRILKNGVFEIAKYKESLEIFQNINYLAELRK